MRFPLIIVVAVVVLTMFATTSTQAADSGPPVSCITSEFSLRSDADLGARHLTLPPGYHPWTVTVSGVTACTVKPPAR